MSTSFAILIPDFILLWSVLVPKISEYTIWQTVLAKHIIMILLESCYWLGDACWKSKFFNVIGQ